MFTMSPANKGSGHDMVRDAINDASTECVVDAVGPPFFYFGPESSLTTYYPTPDLKADLDDKYRPAGVVYDCQTCTIYVRR